LKLELKTLEKINRKGNRNSRKIEKTNSAQVGPFSPAPVCAPARPLCLTGGSRLSAPTRARSLPSLSLAAPWGRAVDVVSLARTRSLSLCPAVPTCQPVSNLPPTISPPWTHPRPRVLRPRPSRRVPFDPRALLAHLPSLICALGPAPSPSLLLCPREPRAPPPPVDVHRLFRGRHCARAPSSATVSFTLPSATRETLRCALSLPAVSGPRSPESLLAQPESATIALSSTCASAVISRRQRFCSR
jgi:hypothetical protein